MYDYVIVGAGSAGCVLAARLSEDPDVRVCLIEAGPADTAENIHVPASFGRLFRTDMDWDYDTHEEPGLGNRRVFLPRGKVLGGCSSTNAMVYARGNRLDYDAWNQPGWSYDELLPYFIRSEDNERGESEYHGAGGPLSVSDGRSKNPMSTAFVEAAVQAGHAANDDFNGAIQDGFGAFQVTQRDGRRCSAAVAFLHPVMSRPNLTVETHLQVHRVLMENGRAVGVVGRRLDEEITLRADREVVLSAGAYNTPKLLQLSGIGPAQLLSALGIPVVLDQPMVGQNLQDHGLVPLVYTHSHPISLLVAGAPESVQEFVEHGRGPLTSNGPEAGGFVRTRPDLPAPDVEFLTAPIMFVDSGLSAPVAHAISTGPVVLTQQSRGMVLLASDDPSTKPWILHNYYADPADLDTAVAGLRVGLEIARQEALAPYTETGFRVPDSESDADLRAFARRYTHSLYHPAGTCAMGSVVDAELRVQGVEGLRVVDTSVMPVVGRGNLNAPAIAIAEKAADLIAGRPAPRPHATSLALAD
ncbi:MAG TPA: GMC family oxidoreductase N-terminal domain-containing protein [Pseudonocardiaceae bacterium]